MKVHGEEIPEHLIDHALSRVELHRGFTLHDLTIALSRAGASDKLDVLYRCADRALQKLRKKGAIGFDGKVWRVVAPSK